jgi:hypothetical protein
MAEQFSVTYREKSGKPMFVVTWEPYDFNNFKLAGRNNDGDNDGIFWEAYFSFPFFDVTDHPEINRVVEQIYSEFDNGNDTEELMTHLGTVVLSKPELKNKYVPDFLIKNNEINWTVFNKITQGVDLPDKWDKLVIRLESGLPKPSIISANKHEYIFHNCCSLFEEYAADGDLVLNSLPNTSKLVFNEVGVENHDILLDMYCKTDSYYALCTPDGSIRAYTVNDKYKNIKAFCLI